MRKFKLQYLGGVLAIRRCDVWQAVRHLDLNIKRQVIDALEGDVLDASNGHAMSSTDIFAGQNMPDRESCSAAVKCSKCIETCRGRSV